MRPLTKRMICPSHLVDRRFVSNVLERVIDRYENTVDSGLLIRGLESQRVKIERADINPIDNRVYCHLSIDGTALSSLVGRTVWARVISTRVEGMARVEIFLSRPDSYPFSNDPVGSSYLDGSWNIGETIEATVKNIQFIAGRQHYTLENPRVLLD